MITDSSSGVRNLLHIFELSFKFYRRRESGEARIFSAHLCDFKLENFSLANKRANNE